MFKKKDAVIYAAAAALVIISWLCCRVIFSEEGSRVLVSVDSKQLAEYDLKEDIREEIHGVNGGSCLLVISDGVAYVESASCPDKICVNHGSITTCGESIICLPSRIVIEIR